MMNEIMHYERNREIAMPSAASILPTAIDTNRGPMILPLVFFGPSVSVSSYPPVIIYGFIHHLRIIYG